MVTRAFAALAEDPHLVPDIHMGQLTTTLISGNSVPSSGLYEHWHTDTDAHHLHICRSTHAHTE